MLIGYLILALMVIGTGLFLMAFTYPELLAKGAKFLFRAVKHAAGRPVLKPEQEEAKAKAKKLAPSMSLANQIEQITPGQSLRYKIPEPEKWGCGFLTVELNPQYPQKGRKYILSTENAVHGMPGGEKTIICDSDNSIEVATLVLERDGEPFVVAEEKPVSAEKVAVNAKKEAGGAGKAGTVV